MPSSSYDSTLHADERRRLGAWYTPAALVEYVVRHTVGAVQPGQRVRVLDPACGDGRFLVAAAQFIRSQGAVPELVGADIDLRGLRQSEILDASGEDAHAIEADSLAYDWAGQQFDVVVGNPPFLSQMATATSRTGGSNYGGGTYADAAADFLALALRVANPAGGRVGLILPVSLLTTRDAGPIRAIARQSASMDWFWWSPEPLFDASVRTCAIGFSRGAGLDHSVVRSVGPEFAPLADLAHTNTAAANDHWGWLIADAMGLPEVPPLQTSGQSLSDYGLVTANFRDQYYGLVGSVSDSADGPPLITTGLIDVGRCLWGSRGTRFAKERFEAPRVDRSGHVPFMQRWTERCLVPKVLVATQTKVIEAVADPLGEWLPAVPVVRVVPASGTDLWQIAAVLTSPVASAIIAAQSAGSGLSATTVRVSQRTLGALAWPAGSLDEAVQALHGGDFAACAAAVDAAYGVRDDTLLAWWLRGAGQA